MPWTPDLPYPKREYLETPATVTDRIYDELKFSGTTNRDVRNALGIELHEIYKDTALGEYLYFYAGALVKAERLKSSDESDIRLDDKYRPEVIYAGSMLAMRSMLNGLSYEARTDILNFSALLTNLADIQELAPEGVQTIEQMVELIEAKDEIMSNFPEDVQLAIMEAAEQYCAGGDVSIARQREEDFILGFVASANVTANLRDILKES